MRLPGHRVTRGSCALRLRGVAEGQIVFARAALVGMAFNCDRVVPVLLQPLGLLGQCLLRIGTDDRESVRRRCGRRR